jgi:hypothetical protein
MHFPLLRPGLTVVTLLESESGFEIVTRLSDIGNDHLHKYSLWHQLFISLL